jgi:ornithine cyclodeaminase/alanine dehydrogenase-like protein (mu-crystallin family)
VKHEVLVLSDDDVRTLLTRALCREVMTAAFRDYAAGRMMAPKKVAFSFPAGPLVVGPAHVPSAEAFGMKFATIRPENRGRGLPSAFLYIPLFEVTSGQLRSLVAGNTITALRTAATSAVASQALARPESRTLAIVGPGSQGREHVHALAEVFSLDRIYITGGQHPESAARLAAELVSAYGDRVRTASVEAAVREADLVVTATRATQPVIDRAWVRPGTHFNAVGTDTPEERELDPAILQAAVIIVDSWEQCVERGEVQGALASGALTPDQIQGSLGDLLLGRVRGRTDPDQITVFDSTGVFFQDVALAGRLVQRAHADGLGTWVTL